MICRLDFAALVGAPLAVLCGRPTHAARTIVWSALAGREVQA